MTMQAEQLIGARVTGGDGQVVGTVQQVFNDDTDGRPVWARVRAGTRDRFVPLAGGQVTKNGLRVPYDARQIMSSPEIGAERHISAAQTDQLRRHFGLTVPAQGGPSDVETQVGDVQGEEATRGQGRPGEAPRGDTGRGETGRGETGRGDTGRGETGRGEAGRGETERGEAQRGQARPGDAPRGEAMRGEAGRGEAGRGEAMRGEAGRGQAPPGDAMGGTERGEAMGGTERGEAMRGTERGEDWLIRAEERVDVGTEMHESGRARLHKYVDVEPLEQAVRVFHEEYEIERVPITAEEQMRGVIAEGEQEIILHEERAVVRKETVPVERVRLVVRRVAEDRTLRDEIRKERIEVEADGTGRTSQSADAGQEQRRS
jgi:stress response protein YsnF/sporulation protein YlmC with PRC-barrel domain